ncbi:MAG: penicillin acylase family protein, partial [Gaiellales bacterium]
MRRGLATAACCLLAAPPAAAEIKQAGSVMPPGQSGFVSAPCLVDSSACDPQLTDQIPLFVDFQYKSSMLGQPGTEEIPKAGVRIVRDDYGVPSVYGDTESDMWWGMGYAIARDRLFQIEAFRRATTGTLAEILGKGALEDDIIARRDFYTQAEREEMVESLPGDLKSRWQAYADGVNAWIDEVNADPGKMPAEFAALGAAPEPLRVHEMAAIGIYLARTTPSDDGEEMANLEAFEAVGAKAFDRVFPLRTPGQFGTVPRNHGLFPSRPGMTRKQERRAFTRSSKYARRLPLPEEEDEASASSARALGRFYPSLGGSKMWAMRKLGHAWLLTGPQLGFVMPERLVEIELHSPTLDVRGTTAAGAPVIGIGHNEHVAWGVTSGLGDEDDLYAEETVGDEGYR